MSVSCGCCVSGRGLCDELITRPEESYQAVVYQGILFGGWGSRNSDEDRGQRERGSGGGTPLGRSSAKFLNECNLYSY
jgi:hypothetical protein